MSDIHDTATHLSRFDPPRFSPLPVVEWVHWLATRIRQRADALGNFSPPRLMSWSSVETWKWIATQLAAFIIGGMAVLVTVILTMPEGLTKSQVVDAIRVELQAMPRPITTEEVRLLLADELSRRPDTTTPAESLQLMETHFSRVSKERGYYAMSGEPRVVALETRATALERSMELLRESVADTTSTLKQSLVRMEVLIDRQEQEPIVQPQPRKTFFSR